MSLELFNNTKNLIEMQEIKNFKTQKFKHRKKDQSSYYSQLYFHHRHQPLQYNCTTNFNYLRIYQFTQPSSIQSDISLVQIASTLQLSIISTSCVKMCLTIILLLSIITSHLANCQMTLERDNNIIFFNRNNLSEHLLQYIKSKQYIINKRLILENKSTINDKIVKYEGALKSINHTRETTSVLKTINNIQIGSSNKNEKINNEENYRKLKQENLENNKTGGYISYQNNRNSDKPNSIVTPDIPILEFSKTYTQNQVTSNSPISDPHLLKIVMEGLGLQTIPDFRKANISQSEYAAKYNEYLNRIRERNLRELRELDLLLDQSDDDILNTSLSLLTIPHNSSDMKEYRHRRSTGNKEGSRNKTIFLRFPLNIDNELKASDIEEANIRLLLITSPALATTGIHKQRHRFRANGSGIGNRKSQLIALYERNNSSINKKKRNRISDKPQKHILNMKVYQLLEPKGRVYIDGRKIEIKIDRTKMDDTTSQWLQFDVTKAVEGWIVNKQANLGLEIQCDNCFKNGARIIDDISGDSGESADSSDEYDLTPVLNIIGRLGTHREKRSKHHHNQMTEKPQHRVRKSNCYKDNQRCCRHAMEVVFKEIKGFEFIIQPKVFDAGYCRGRCPPRYNPAHHHALLQSLIWKQDRTKAPRPCCAPSKLIELEVLHVDEKDNEKLKISTWTDMRVLECACS